MLLSFEFNGIVYDEVEYSITPENYQDYRDLVPERIFESYQLALSEPSILQPCDSTIWYLGDIMEVFWQGASLHFHSTSSSRIIDSLYVTLPLPDWYYNMELYHNGDYVETISPPNHRNHTEPLDIESLDERGGSFMVKTYPMEEIGNRIEDNASGSAYQIRMIFWDKDDRRGNVNHTECIELWSECFSIDEPWLDILEPNESTVWSEDSNDVYVEYVAHGLFGHESPESIAPRVRLFQGNKEVESFGITGRFEDSSLRSNTPVSNYWGNGPGFRISLEIDGESFFSDYFSIYGQTIRILSPEPYLLPLDSLMVIEWCSWADLDFIVFLFGMQIKPRPSSGTTVSIELYRVNSNNQPGNVLSNLVSDIQNDGYFIYGKSYDKDWIGENLRLKIVDSDGNYGWSEVFCIDQQRGWF